MSRDNQLDQLAALYAEKSDDELLALDEQRDDLTDVAQQAMLQAMSSRKLSRASAAASVPEVDDVEGGPDDRLQADERLVYLFHDAFEAREAIRQMDEAEIAFRMLDWHNVEPERAASYTGVDLGLVVARMDVGRATGILKEKLGLFPAPEKDGTLAAGNDELIGLSLLARQEALAVAHALGEAGISYMWSDGRDEAAGLPDVETISLQVQPDRVAEAMKIVEGILVRD